MLDPAVNVAATFWAAITFRATATFDDPSPVYDIIPQPNRTRGATYVGFEVAVPGSVLLVTYRLDVPLLENERIIAPGVHALFLTPLAAPFFPLPFTLAASDPSLLQYPVLITESPPPQFSPPTALEYQATIFRAIP